MIFTVKKLMKSSVMLLPLLIASCGTGPANPIAGTHQDNTLSQQRIIPGGLPTYNPGKIKIRPEYAQKLSTSPIVNAELQKLGISIAEMDWSNGAQSIAAFSNQYWDGVIVIPSLDGKFHVKIDVIVGIHKAPSLPEITPNQIDMIKVESYDSGNRIRLLLTDTISKSSSILDAKIASDRNIMNFEGGDFRTSFQNRNVLVYKSQSMVGNIVTTYGVPSENFSPQSIKINPAPGYELVGEDCESLLDGDGGIITTPFVPGESAPVTCKAVPPCPPSDVMAGLSLNDPCYAKLPTTNTNYDPCLLPYDILVALEVSKNDVNNKQSDYEQDYREFISDTAVTVGVDGTTLLAMSKACGTPIPKGSTQAYACAALALGMVVITNNGIQKGISLNQAKADYGKARITYNVNALNANTYYSNSGCSKREPIMPLDY